MFDLFAAQLLGNLHLAKKQHQDYVNPPESSAKMLATPNETQKPTRASPPDNPLPAEALPVNPT